MGRVTVTTPPSTPSAVMSVAQETPSRAATRGAESRPIAVAANTIAP